MLMRILKKSFPSIGVIADDLTGCGDVGVFLKLAGLRVRIITSIHHYHPALCTGCDALVINTDSRLCTPRTAYQRVAAAAGILKRLGIQFFFKKVDSTLRGNIGSELDSFITTLNIAKLPFVAAFPSAGRTTKNGTQYVRNKVLHKTFFGKDPRSRIVSSHIPTLLKKTSRFGNRIMVMDAVKSSDLKNIVAEHPYSAYAGASGIMAELISLWVSKLKRKHGHASQIKTYQQRKITQRERRILIVQGSMHPINRLQVKAIIGRKKTYALWIIRGPYTKAHPAAVTRQIIRKVKRLLVRVSCDRIILIGGDTAQRVCRALGISYLDIERVLEKGVVQARANTGQEIILKPGGFGNRFTLRRCLH